MLVTQKISETRAARKALGTVAMVPTMGALHEGHISLMHAARALAPRVAVSIFVNPTQFGPHEDFTKYPRPIDSDLSKCRQAGVDLVFNPSPEEMYPSDQPLLQQAIVDIPPLTTVLEGKHRPGHFHGVCQVVSKLLNIVQPDIICFGQKDYQQFRVLEAMVSALDFPVEMKMLPTVREPDGLAMSSRNIYLSPDERKRALAISQALFKARDDVQSGIHQTNRLITTMQNILLEKHLLIDYVAAVEAQTLRPVDQVISKTVLAIAVRLGTTRLIDNIIVAPH